MHSYLAYMCSPKKIMSSLNASTAKASSSFDYALPVLSLMKEGHQSVATVFTGYLVYRESIQSLLSFPVLRLLAHKILFPSH